MIVDAKRRNWDKRTYWPPFFDYKARNVVRETIIGYGRQTFCYQRVYRRRNADHDRRPLGVFLPRWNAVFIGEVANTNSSDARSGFSSSGDALQASREAPHRFDVVLTDESMPELTGIELLLRQLFFRYLMKSTGQY
jgi:CheY-like chemotaxis protein